MSKKYFETACAELEAKGYTLVEFEPENKYAVYTLNGKNQVIGRKK